MERKVVVVGAGPCGLSQLQAFARARQQGADIPEIVCYEKQDDWGGLWHYSWRVGLDAHGEPNHGSMYRYLWSNGPKECLEFADYGFEEHFGRPIPSFPPRAVLADYIFGRAKQSGVRDWIRFSTVVRDIAFDARTGKFSVTTESLPDHVRHQEECDHVVVASGHFSVPNMPDFPGIETFPGRIMHAHDFRDAREFKGRHVLVVGSSYSAEDIGLQTMKYGAASVTTCYRTQAMGFKWPAGMDERALLTRIEQQSVHFKDGSKKDFDAIILCTGYQHSFPFLRDELRLRTHNRLYPPKLYKGVVWCGGGRGAAPSDKNVPQLFYIGMQDQFYTFSMFDLQAWYARDVMLGRIQLPDGPSMDADIAQWVAREEKLADPEQQIDFQADYLRDIVPLTDYPKFDIDSTVASFKRWEHDKMDDILGYRNKAFPSPVTGTVAPLHPASWWEEMDDSMEHFLQARA